MTIRECILINLVAGPNWGGLIEDFVREHNGAKGDTCARRLREMVDEGILDVCYAKVNGEGPEVVRYRIKPKWITRLAQ